MQNIKLDDIELEIELEEDCYSSKNIFSHTISLEEIKDIKNISEETLLSEYEKNELLFGDRIHDDDDEDNFNFGIFNDQSKDEICGGIYI
jgi:hypothetical protein